MRICYFDAFSGLSGDMAVGALVDAGAPWEPLHSALDSLLLPAHYRVEKTKRHGMAATKFFVQAQEERKHRHLPQILKIIEQAELTERSRTRAVSIFHRLAEAEARSHAVPIEKVHFHEVGAADSIADIVACAAALDLLEIDEVQCSPVNVGSGTVETQHGTLPVPAPATAELLRERPVYASGPQAELTTPTGAAIVATLGTRFGAAPYFQLRAQGFGAGTKDFSDRANVLRVLIGESSSQVDDSAPSNSITVLEATVDDCSPEVLGYTMERLLAAGALDVALIPAYMKKSRPGTIISVLCPHDSASTMADILLVETSTLGVRSYQAQRRILHRTLQTVETRWGPVRVKAADGGKFAPEYEDCRRIALAQSIPLRVVFDEATLAHRNHL